MHYRVSDLSESSQSSHLISTDTASNWSRPAKKLKGKCQVASVHRRITRAALARKIPKRKRLENKYLVAGGPHLRLRRYCFKMHRIPPKLGVRQLKSMIEKISDESRVVYSLWPLCIQQTVELEAEVVRLQQRLHELQVEEIEIKRSRWCSVCEDEATYVRGKRFYCSKECEQKVGALE